jgi:CO/xanthine dehydrogenase Mo-binding subunit
MTTELALNRRTFLKSSLLAGGGLALTVSLPVRGGEGAAQARVLNAYIHVPSEGPITLVMPKVEMGQGTYTSLPMLIAEELEVRLDQIRTEPAPPDPKVYGVEGDQSTGGSTSIRDCWLPLRKAGAAARMMLITAAARAWVVPTIECRALEGAVTHVPTGRSLSYGALAGAAAHATPPRKIALKKPGEFRLLGRSTRRLDTPGKVDGSTRFGIDARLPGMRYAMIAQAPVMGGRVAHMDRKAALAIAGVRQVVHDEDLVAVVADHTHAAMKGLSALNLTWNGGTRASIQQAGLVAALDTAVKHRGALAHRNGDPVKAAHTGKQTVSALYHQPFLAHATMEPMNCTVHWRKDHCEIWVGTQAPDRVVEKLAVFGLKPEQITLHNHLIGGGFGRRLEVDGVEIATRVARHVDAPVQVLWSRAEDIQHDRYRPYYVDALTATLDDNGSPTSWQHTIAGGSASFAWDGKPLKNGVDDDAVESSANPAYALPNFAVRYVRQDPDGIPISWWRGVGPTRSVYVVESFIDELAHAAGQDPIAYRRPLLKDERLRSVIDRIAKESNWATPLPPGRGRGVSIQAAFGSYLAQVVEVTIDAGYNVTVDRVVCVMDCGLAINPENVRAQLEGGVIFGLSAALMGEVTVKDGRIEQSNFNDYPVLRLAESPNIETHLIESTENPGGVGETGTACIAAALCNAIFAATGQRVRTLPVTRGLRRE